MGRMKTGRSMLMLLVLAASGCMMHGERSALPLCGQPMLVPEPMGIPHPMSTRTADSSRYDRYRVAGTANEVYVFDLAENKGYLLKRGSDRWEAAPGIPVLP